MIRTILRALSGRRGQGYLPDRPDARDHLYRVSRARAPRAVSWRAHVPEVLNQRAMSSCVAHAVLAAIDTALRRSGTDPYRPSRLFAYYNSRRAHGAEGRDAGTYIRTCIKTCRKQGFPPESSWPYLIRRVNKPPPWPVYVQGTALRLRRLEYERITGLNRLASVRDALARGRLVVFGTGIDRSFLRSGGPHVIDRPSTTVGRHAMVIVGYNPDGFEVLNSWGKGWRDGGFVTLTESYINWRGTRDVWSIGVTR